MTRRKVLTDQQVREIRAQHMPYVMGYEQLAKKYGVGASTIRDIVKYWTRAGAGSSPATKEGFNKCQKNV